MNKIDSEHENPLDRVLMDISGSLLPFFHCTGHVPNVLTTYSFAAGLGAVACLWHDRPYGFVVLMTISYFFDTMDGQFAREYNQTSRFGDLYDHITDAVVILLIVHAVIHRGKRPVTWQLVILGGIALLLMTTHFGCQQRWKNPSLAWETLDLNQGLCPDREWIHWTRFFCPGTLNFFVIIMAWYMFQPPNAPAKED